MKRKTIRAADLFCGAGGTSSGLVLACNELENDLELLAVNHWDVAISTHSANHPKAHHLCESLENIDPKKVVAQIFGADRLHLMCASPECTHHSVARGGRPMNDQSRASAWHILWWAQHIYIDNILIENVKEFQTWGPLGANGRPLKSKRGETFYAFINALKSLGYNVDYRVLNAADYGDPTTRERLFVLARRGNKKIVWPEPTHTRIPSDGLFGRLKPWVAAREIIDWSIPGKSIFNRKKPLAMKTLERIYAGLKKFGGPNAEPFLIVLRQHMNAQSIDEPLPTLTAGGNHIGLCEPVLIPFFGERDGQQPRTHSVDDPMPAVTSHGAGAIVETFLLPHPRKHDQPHSVDRPLRTVTASSSDIALVEADAFLIGQGGPSGSGKPKSIDDPLDTVLTENHRAVVQPVLINMKGKSDATSVDAPIPTQTTKNHLYVAEPFICAYRGNHAGRDDGANRNRSLDEPLPTQDCSNRYALVETEGYILQQQSGGALRPVSEPVPTVATGGAIAVVQPILVNIDHRGGNGNQVRSVDQPVPTVTTKARTAVVETFLLDVNHGRNAGDCAEKDGARRCKSVDEPLPTVTSKRGKGLVEAYLVKYNGTAKAQSVEEPLDTVSTKDRFALVTTDHGTYAIDIRLRMLKTHELARAQGFPIGYQFSGSLEQKTKQIGNAVPVNLAKALTKALVGEYAS
jgi:DNA (cytosine-5)-methyltransferase 1